MKKELQFRKRDWEGKDPRLWRLGRGLKEEIHMDHQWRGKADQMFWKLNHCHCGSLSQIAQWELEKQELHFLPLLSHHQGWRKEGNGCFLASLSYPSSFCVPSFLMPQQPWT